VAGWAFMVARRAPSWTVDPKHLMKRGHMHILEKSMKQWASYSVLALVMIGFLILSTLLFRSVHKSNHQPENTPPAHLTHADSTSTPALTSGPGPTLAASVPGDWPTYMADNGHSGFNPAENVITAASAPQLRLKWKVTAGNYVASQPVEANGLIYWGSWDGFEHATDLNDRTVWKINLGVTQDPACDPSFAGVTSTATIASAQRNGKTIAVDFVGGGDGNLYALDARTGEIIWKQLLGPPPHYYLWGSPAVYRGSVYIGISSFGDCPLIRGGVVQLDMATGHIQHIFNTVPHRCIGASIWTTPTIDEAAGTLYVSTGNAKPCSHGKPYGDALVELRASNLSLIASWQVPFAEQIADGDFGSTPTLFKTSSGIPMVGLENKNGLYYAFQRDDLSKPIWQVRIATHRASVSSSAWDGHRLYVAGRAVLLGDASCLGSLAALNPDTGAIIWQHCLTEDETGALGLLVAGAVAAAPGVIAYGQGADVIVLDAASGKLLFSYHDADRDAAFYGWASLSHGVLYIGSTDGKLFAFAPQ